MAIGKKCSVFLCMYVLACNAAMDKSKSGDYLGGRRLRVSDTFWEYQIMRRVDLVDNHGYVLAHVTYLIPNKAHSNPNERSNAVLLFGGIDCANVCDNQMDEDARIIRTVVGLEYAAFLAQKTFAKLAKAGFRMMSIPELMVNWLSRSISKKVFLDQVLTRDNNVFALLSLVKS